MRFMQSISQVRIPHVHALKLQSFPRVCLLKLKQLRKLEMNDENKKDCSTHIEQSLCFMAYILSR